MWKQKQLKKPVITIYFEAITNMLVLKSTLQLRRSSKIPNAYICMNVALQNKWVNEWIPTTHMDEPKNSRMIWIQWSCYDGCFSVSRRRSFSTHTHTNTLSVVCTSFLHTHWFHSKCHWSNRNPIKMHQRIFYTSLNFHLCARNRRNYIISYLGVVFFSFAFSSSLFAIPDDSGCKAFLFSFYFYSVNILIDFILFPLQSLFVRACLQYARDFAICDSR